MVLSKARHKTRRQLACVQGNHNFSHFTESSLLWQFDSECKACAESAILSSGRRLVRRPRSVAAVVVFLPGGVRARRARCEGRYVSCKLHIPLRDCLNVGLNSLRSLRNLRASRQGQKPMQYMFSSSWRILPSERHSSQFSQLTDAHDGAL